MKYLFLDESGELGFKLTSSRYFLIAILSCDDNEIKKVRKIIKRIRTRKLKKKLKELTELKANNTSKQIREAVLKKLNSLNIEIYTIILDKKQVYDYLKNKKDKLYNYVSHLIISECSINDKNIDLFVDKRGAKIIASEFTNYITEKLKGINKKCKLKVYHLDSKIESGLQVVDFVSWSIFRKYEHKDDSYYNIIKSKIKLEKKFEENYMDPKRL